MVKSADGRFTGEPAAVSERMRRIKSRGTQPEVLLFRYLADTGIPFAPHVRVAGVTVDAHVDGRIAVFVDSPFWHLRDDATLERLTPYWQSRLLTNRERDRRQTRLLRQHGYRVVRFWADELNASRLSARLRRVLSGRRLTLR